MQLDELVEEVERRADVLAADLERRCPGLPSRLSVDAFAKRLQAPPPLFDHYEDMPRAALRLLAGIKKSYGATVLSVYLKGVLCALLRDALRTRYHT